VLDSSNPIFGGAKLLRASTSGLSLSNGGGVVTVRDAASSVITSITYGPNSIPGDANQSITRSPDVLGSLALHQSANGSQARAFSPGTRVDGNSFVPSPRVASVIVTPQSADVLKGAVIQFSAKALDEANQDLSNVIFNWSSSDISVVAIDSNGT
jgi:hypothetical protein